MMCRLIHLCLPLYAGGELSGMLSKWIFRHLSQCDACTADLNKLRAAQNRIRILAERDTPALPLDFAAQVREQIAKESHRIQKTPRQPRWGWVAAAVLLLAGLGWFSTYDKSPELLENTEPAVASLQSEEDFSDGDLAAMMSLLQPNRELTDAELDRKYPVIESMDFPYGTQMLYHTDDPNTKIVWIFAQEGAQVQ